MSLTYDESGGNNMTKTCAVLYIYDLLRNHGKLKLMDIKSYFNCSHRTAARYIAELKKYFRLLNVNYKVEFSPSEKTYKLIEIKKD